MGELQPEVVHSELVIPIGPMFFVFRKPMLISNTACKRSIQELLESLIT